MCARIRLLQNVALWFPLENTETTAWMRKRSGSEREERLPSDCEEASMANKLTKLQREGLRKWPMSLKKIRFFQ